MSALALYCSYPRHRGSPNDHLIVGLNQTVARLKDDESAMPLLPRERKFSGQVSRNCSKSAIVRGGLTYQVLGPETKFLAFPFVAHRSSQPCLLQEPLQDSMCLYHSTSNFSPTRAKDILQPKDWSVCKRGTRPWLSVWLASFWGRSCKSCHAGLENSDLPMRHLTFLVDLPYLRTATHSTWHFPGVAAASSCVSRVDLVSVLERSGSSAAVVS